MLQILIYIFRPKLKIKNGGVSDKCSSSPFSLSEIGSSGFDLLFPSSFLYHLSYLQPLRSKLLGSYILFFINLYFFISGNIIVITKIDR